MRAHSRVYKKKERAQSSYRSIHLNTGLDRERKGDRKTEAKEKRKKDN